MDQFPDTTEDSADPLGDAIALALAHGASQNEAASQAGCSRTTVVRRLQDAGFRDRVQHLRREILQAATSKLSSKIATAIDCLVRLLESESEPVKLGAAKAMLQALLPLNMQSNLEERISQLENRP